MPVLPSAFTRQHRKEAGKRAAALATHVPEEPQDPTRSQSSRIISGVRRGRDIGTEDVTASSIARLGAATCCEGVCIVTECPGRCQDLILSLSSPLASCRLWCSPQHSPTMLGEERDGGCLVCGLRVEHTIPRPATILRNCDIRQLRARSTRCGLTPHQEEGPPCRTAHPLQPRTWAPGEWAFTGRQEVEDRGPELEGSAAHPLWRVWTSPQVAGHGPLTTIWDWL